MENFNLWSKNNPEALKILKPDLGFRSWNFLNSSEKELIFTYFKNKEWFEKNVTVYYAVANLNERYKLKSYGENLLKHGKLHQGLYAPGCCFEAAFKDLSNITTNCEESVVYEMYSFFAYHSIEQDSYKRAENETDLNRKQDLIRYAYRYFDQFAIDFNDIFEQFGLNVLLTRGGLVPRQDDRITKDIYVPVLTYLADTKWSEVNRNLCDAFSKFHEKSPQGYSSCVTLTVTSLQAFLQILVYNKTGKGEINKLVPEAIENGLIPNDIFTSKILKDIESVLMTERQNSGDPHPKREYANERTSLLVMNLAMIFIQHCITSTK